MLVEVWPIERVKPYHRNPRVDREEKAVIAVAASIKEFGFRQPLVVDADGVLIVGHRRLLAAKRLKMTEVPVHVASDMEPGLVAAYRIADNRTHEESEWHAAMLGMELRDLKAAGIDPRLTMFNDHELATMLDATTFQPILAPTLESKQHTAGDMAKAQAKVDEQFRNPGARVLRSVTCPHCMGEFFLDE